MSDFTPKMGRDGDIRWTSFYTHGTAADGTSYVMVGAAGATSRGQIEVVQDKANKAWTVELFGEVVETTRTKVDAQWAAEALVRS